MDLAWLTRSPRGHLMNCFRFAPILLLAAGTALAQAPAAPNDDSSPRRPPRSRASICRPSTRPPIPARISISTPAATGSRTIRFPADQVRWARSFSLLRERNRYLLWQELDAAAKDPKTPLRKAVWRLLCRLHEYRPGGEEGPEAARACAQAHRRPQGRAQAGHA